MAPDLLLVSTPLEARDLPGGVCPSLSNITLGSALLRAGVAVSVLDPSVDVPRQPADRFLERIAEAVLSEDPRVIGVSCLSPAEGRFGVALARAVKARDAARPVVLGGIWATAAAEQVLRREPAVDGVVTGPGEVGALVLARQGLARPDEVPGLFRRRGGEIVRNAEAPLPRDPASVDLSLLRRPEAYDIFCWLASRGCPFDCEFCTEALTAPHYLADPMPKVKADLAAIAAVGAGWYLWVCDPLFGTHRARTAEICAALGETGCAFLAESRVDVLHPDDVPKLAAGGCNLIYFGLESATRRSLVELAKIGKPEARYRRYLEGARALVVACLENDVLPVMGVLNPVPGDAPDDLRTTLDFLTELRDLGGGLGERAHGLGPCFHAFPLRFDLGAPYDARLDALRAQGVTFLEPPDPLFDDRYIARASPTIDEATAEAFRAEVRALNPAAPAVQRRLMRSFPRRYVAF